jgi:hypothetical protein
MPFNLEQHRKAREFSLELVKHIEKGEEQAAIDKIQPLLAIDPAQQLSDFTFLTRYDDVAANDLTLLHFAARYNMTQLAIKLIESGIDPTLRSKACNKTASEMTTDSNLKSELIRAEKLYIQNKTILNQYPQGSQARPVVSDQPSASEASSRVTCTIL